MLMHVKLFLLQQVGAMIYVWDSRVVVTTVETDLEVADQELMDVMLICVRQVVNQAVHSVFQDVDVT